MGSDKTLPKSKQSPRKNVKESSGKRSSISSHGESSDEEIVTKKEPMSVLSKKSKSPSPKRTSPRRSYKKRKDSKQDYNDVDGDFGMDDVDEIVDNISEIKKSPKTRKSSPRVKQSPTKPKSPPKTKQPSPKTKQSNTKKEKSKYIVIGDEDEKDDKDVKMEELTDSNGKPVPVPSKKFNPYGARNTAPPKKGKKEIPIGNDFCLHGKKLIIQYGGNVVKAAKAKSLTHVLYGDDPGPSKIEQAHKRDLVLIDEDGLFDLIRTESKKSLNKKEKEKVAKKLIPKSEKPIEIKVAKVTKNIQATNNAERRNTSSNSLWTTLYHPTKSSDLVGNPSKIDKLKKFLAEWKADTKKEKAALLSGPPGVGKTS